jgi:hypothetical protein
MKNPPEKQKRATRRKRNLFARKGWRRFIMRGVLADQAARTGETCTDLRPGAENWP